MKKSNEQIFNEIIETGFITKADLQLLKRRSIREGRDIFDYSIFDKIDEIRITPEQGAQGLRYFTHKLSVLCVNGILF